MVIKDIEYLDFVENVQADHPVRGGMSGPMNAMQMAQYDAMMFAAEISAQQSAQTNATMSAQTNATMSAQNNRKSVESRLV